MIQFYAPDILETKLLPESDSQHCIKVLRMSAGDKVEVVDGKGHRFLCEIISPHPKKTLVEIESEQTVDRYWTQQLVVAVAPTKHIDRMEWMVEKLTEIGINRIIPMLCERSERREIKTERLEKIAVSAMKQSLQAYLPEVNKMTKFNEIAESFAGFNKLIAYCDKSIPRVDLTKEYIPGKDTVIMIGPEGDFTANEIKKALDFGWKPVTLGENRLRTETASIAAIQAMHTIDALK